MVLIIFCGRALTLPGAGLGLAHMFTPDVCVYVTLHYKIYICTTVDDFERIVFCDAYWKKIYDNRVFIHVLLT